MSSIAVDLLLLSQSSQSIMSTTDLLGSTLNWPGKGLHGLKSSGRRTHRYLYRHGVSAMSSNSTD